MKITPVFAVVVENKATAYFPAINLNSHLDDVDEALLDGGALRAPVVVRKIIVLSSSDFERVANSLQNDYDELWEQIGGSQCDDKLLRDYTPRTTEWYVAWAKHCETFVVQVVEEGTGEYFFVNSEGFEYARYVGRSAEWFAMMQAKRIIERFQGATI